MGIGGFIGNPLAGFWRAVFQVMGRWPDRGSAAFRRRLPILKPVGADLNRREPQAGIVRVTAAAMGRRALGTMGPCGLPVCMTAV